MSPSLREKQAASRLRHRRSLNPVEETRIRCAMFVLLATGDADDQDLEKVGRMYGRTKAWMERWSRSKYPLLAYF